MLKLNQFISFERAKLREHINGSTRSTPRTAIGVRDPQRPMPRRILLLVYEVQAPSFFVELCKTAGLPGVKETLKPSIGTFKPSPLAFT
jgi:hypothetical protein